MAGDYGLDSGGNVVIQEPANTGTGPATRITGGGAGFSGFAQTSQAPQSNFGAITDSSAKTMDALNKLTQGLLSPIIEAEQQRQYLGGMAQVAQGKALLEIQKEQPWYTRIFGPSATVQGAQAMTLMGAMNQAESQFYQELPSLVSQPPDAARAFLVQQASMLAQTGDPTMDAMVQAKLAEQFGPMMNAHMKQHFKYVQEQNTLAYGNNLVTAGDAYQKKMGQVGFFTPEQLDMEKQRAVDAFMPIAGMSTDAWQKSTVKGLAASMMKGNFGIYEAFKETPEYQNLPVEARMHLETQLQPYASQWVQRNLPSFRQDAYDLASLELALSQGTGPQTPESLDAWMDRANAEWQVETGSGVERFDNNQRASLMKAWYKGQEFLAKQQAAARAHGEKMDAEYQDDAAQQTAAMFAANNNGALPPNHSKIKPENVQSIYRKVRDDLEAGGDTDGMREWVAKLAVVSQNGSKWLDQDLSMQMTTAANNFLQQGMPVSDQMMQQLQYMQIMAQRSNGLSGLANYIGATNAEKMTALVKSGVDLTDRDALDFVRVSIDRGWGVVPTAQDEKAITRFLEDQDTFLQRNLPIFGTGALTGYDLNDPSKKRLGELLAPVAARMVAGNGLAMEDAIPIAFNLMFGDGSKVDYVDGTFTQPNPASSYRSMFTAVSELRDLQSQTSEDYQSALSRTINKAMGFDVDKVPVPEAVSTQAGKLGQMITDAGNKVLDYKFGITLPGYSPSASEFDPTEYETVSATPLGNGILQIHRVRKGAGVAARPVTVIITADQVATELDSVYAERANKAVESRQQSRDLLDAYRKPIYDPLSDLIK